MNLACPTAKQFLGSYVDQQSDFRPLAFAVVGLNHETAPVAIREQAAVRPAQQQDLLQEWLLYAKEAMLLCTCNRTEVYLVEPKPSVSPQEAFLEVFGHELEGYLYDYQGQEAVEHLFRVTAGLDSLILGETQIQGQVKRAWQAAHDAKSSGTLLNKIAQSALAAGKRVRSETSMSDKVVSVSSAAVELATQVLGKLEGRTTLIIGAGETAELTMTHLREAGAGEVIVVNRTTKHAERLAQKWNGHACAYEYLFEVLPQADVVIASSAAPHYVLHANGLQRALQQRQEALAHSPVKKSAEMFLIDISVPRILDPQIADVPHAHLYNLDDLTQIVQKNLASRRAALPEAHAILRLSSAELQRWYLTRQAGLLKTSKKHLLQKEAI